MDKEEIEKSLEKVTKLISGEQLSSAEKKSVIDEINMILESDPNNLDALYWIGLFYQGEMDFKTALSYYEKIMLIAPNSSQANCAKILMKDCQEFLLFDNEARNNKAGYVFNKKPSMLRNLSPIWLLVIKIILLVLAIMYLVPKF